MIEYTENGITNSTSLVMPPKLCCPLDDTSSFFCHLKAATLF